MPFSIRDFSPRQKMAAVWTRLRTVGQPYLARAATIIAPYRRQAAEWYEKREPREKLLLRVLAGIVAVLFIYNVIYVPVRDWRADLAERVTTRQQELIRLQGMMRSYDRLRGELASTQKRTVPGGRDPALFSVLEMTLTNTVGRAKIGAITPSEHQVPGGFEQYTVEVKLNEIGLPQIVDTLYNLHSRNVPITISNLQIHQHEKDSRTYDVDLTCMALGKTG